jgi:negative regulator of sigma E activity
MTEQINAQISAFIDNELPADEAALLVRRFERDPEARARAMRYTLIGAALRGELLEPHPSVLRQRVAAALSGSPPPSVPRQRERWTERYARPLLGSGIAASVAVVAIAALRSLNEPAAPGTATAAVGPTPLEVRGAAAEEAPSYVVPELGDRSRSLAPIRFTNYLIRHGEFTSGLTRTSVSSNVVGAAMEPAAAGDTASAKPTAEDALE